MVGNKKREEDTKEYEYDGMGFSDFHLSHEKTIRDEAMKNNWQKKQECLAALYLVERKTRLPFKPFGPPMQKTI